VACALARLGTPVAFLGRLGRDPIGEAFTRHFDARGVDVSALQWDGVRPSRVVLVRRDAGGERSFGGFAGDWGEGFADQALAADALAGPLEDLLAAPPGWLLVGTIPLASGASAAALALACGRAAAQGWPLVVDVNWRPTFWDPSAEPAGAPTEAQIAGMQPLLRQAALLKCAREEAEWLFGSADPAAVAAALPQGPAVVVTDGAAPLRWWANGSGGSLTPPVVPLVDSTGAGDAFLAGLLHRLCAEPQLLAAPGEGLGAAMRFASACGALVCGGAGAIDPQPTAAAVEEALRRWGAET
jgi:fructokinase